MNEQPELGAIAEAVPPVKSIRLPKPGKAEPPFTATVLVIAYATYQRRWVPAGLFPDEAEANFCMQTVRDKHPRLYGPHHIIPLVPVQEAPAAPPDSPAQPAPPAIQQPTEPPMSAMDTVNWVVMAS